MGKGEPDEAELRELSRSFYEENQKIRDKYARIVKNFP